MPLIVHRRNNTVDVQTGLKCSPIHVILLFITAVFSLV